MSSLIQQKVQEARERALRAIEREAVVETLAALAHDATLRDFCEAGNEALRMGHSVSMAEILGHELPVKDARRAPNSVASKVIEMLQAGPSTVANLAAAAGVERSTIHKTIWRLKQEGRVMTDDPKGTVGMLFRLVTNAVTPNQPNEA